MGDVVQLKDFRRKSGNRMPAFASTAADSLVPVEFAVGFCDAEQCLQKIARYGVRAINVRSAQGKQDSVNYFVGVKEAIWLNKKILELESISDEEIAQRIDLIQMMENMDLTLLETLWSSFTKQDNQSEA